MARGDFDESSDGIDRAQDPIVSRLRPDPARPPKANITLSGFLGDSDRAGFRRLYFTSALDYYAEFRTEDVMHAARIAADEQPFSGDEATRVTLRRDAPVEYTRTRTGRPIDEFDLDIRLETATRGADAAPLPHTAIVTCGGQTCNAQWSCWQSACGP